MKKLLYTLILGMIFVFSGCAKKEQMMDYIPNFNDSQDGQEVDDTTDNTNDDTDQTITDVPIDTSKTTTKYVKLKDYGAILNIRTTPSKNGQIDGFLAHGEKAEVISISDGWASILRGNDIRYVSADFLVDIRPEAIDPPSITPEPTVTVEPTVSPEPTEEPEPTVTPEPTKKPDPTEKPSATPKPTEKPTPKPTATPKPTEKPTTTPKPTDTPKPTKEPKPTDVVEPTIDPTEDSEDDDI